MILVESDNDGEWDSRTDWHALAEKAARAAIASSRHAALLDSAVDAEISVKFASDMVVQALNAAYRAADKPTNVLSFPMVDSELLDALTAADGGDILLGDVVLAHGVCVHEAAAKRIAIEAHAAHLVVHGVLHLLGYDHESSDADAEAMEELEQQALGAIGVSDPYAVTEVQT
ncbi:MAG: ybeY [Alphaproteobacteria bacterium]|nr:ybeY [Alphaproteobacteria bacterium]